MHMKGFAVAAAAAAGALVGAGVIEGAKPSFGCGPGFDLGAVTFSEYLQLPRTQAAIDAGLTDAAGVLAVLERVDKNENEALCVQLSHGFEVSSKPFAQYLYNIVDDNASTP
jgi:hypothetical protein